MPDKDDVRIRIPFDLAEEIRRVATYNHRTISGEASWALSQIYSREENDDDGSTDLG